MQVSNPARLADGEDGPSRQAKPLMRHEIYPPG